jgi:nitronate monooxygenase
MLDIKKEAYVLSEAENTLFNKQLKELPPLKVGDFIHPFPIIQGGMGINISTFNLPPAVTNLGCIGTLSSANVKSFVPHTLTEEEKKLPLTERSAISTYRAMKHLCLKCMEKSKGPLHVNIMVALEDYTETVKAVCDAKREMPDYSYPLRIISGSGLPMTLPRDLLRFGGPELGIEYGFISSNVRTIKILLTRYKKHNPHYLPSFIVVEGPLSGGHQGLKFRDIVNEESLINVPDKEGKLRYAGYFDSERAPTLKSLVAEHLDYLTEQSEQYIRDIPLIAAGGIWNKEDILSILHTGASGVQIGTRLVCTKECDASDTYKEAVIRAAKKDIILIESPAKRFALSVVTTPMISTYLDKNKENQKYGCQSWLLGDRCTTRGREEYCLCDRLTLGGVKGDWEKMLVTIGQNGYRVNSMTTVHEVLFRFIFGEEMDYHKYGSLLDKFRLKREELIHAGRI